MRVGASRVWGLEFRVQGFIMVTNFIRGCYMVSKLSQSLSGTDFFKMGIADNYFHC